MLDKGKPMPVVNLPFFYARTAGHLICPAAVFPALQIPFQPVKMEIEVVRRTDVWQLGRALLPINPLAQRPFLHLAWGLLRLPLVRQLPMWIVRLCSPPDSFWDSYRIVRSHRIDCGLHWDCRAAHNFYTPHSHTSRYDKPFFSLLATVAATRTCMISTGQLYLNIHKIICLISILRYIYCR
jgi:hypothetical protein